MEGYFGLLIKILCIASTKKIVMVKESYKEIQWEIILVYCLKFYVSPQRKNTFVLLEIN